MKGFKSSKRVCEYHLEFIQTVHFGSLHKFAPVNSWKTSFIRIRSLKVIFDIDKVVFQQIQIEAFRLGISLPPTVKGLVPYA